jgi:hypothetical protein
MSKSLVNKLLIVALLAIPGGTILSKESVPEDCAGFLVEIQIKNADTGRQNGEVEAVVTKNSRRVYYIFFEPDGHLISRDVTSNKVKKIKPGTYFCAVVDENGCTTKREFKIE